VHARRIGVRPAALVAVLLVVAIGVAAAVRATGVLPRDRAHAARSTRTTVTAAAAAPAAIAVTAVPPAHHRHRRLRLPATLPTGRIELPILTYHRIDRPAPGEPAMERRLTVAPADFAAEMRWLAGHGYHGVTERQVYDAVVHGRALPPRPLLVTFDDGCARGATSSCTSAIPCSGSPTRSAAWTARSRRSPGRPATCSR
jgi:hypothetical protein